MCVRMYTHSITPAPLLLLELDGSMMACCSAARPLLARELAANEWDVVSVPEHNTLTVHEGRVAPSGRRLALVTCVCVGGGA